MTSAPEPVITRRADTIERAERAYLARVSGATWAQAAEVAGYSDVSNCCRAVRRVFDELPAPDREHQRHLVRDRLHLRELMRREQDGTARRLEFEHQAADVSLTYRVEP